MDIQCEMNSGSRRVKIRIEMLPEVLEESMFIAFSGYSEIDKTVW